MHAQSHWTIQLNFWLTIILPIWWFPEVNHHIFLEFSPWDWLTLNHLSYLLECVPCSRKIFQLSLSVKLRNCRGIFFPLATIATSLSQVIITTGVLTPVHCKRIWSLSKSLHFWISSMICYKPFSSELSCRTQLYQLLQWHHDEQGIGAVLKIETPVLVPQDQQNIQNHLIYERFLDLLLSDPVVVANLVVA